MDMDGGMRGGRAKRDSDRARSYKEHKRNSGVRTDSRVTVEAAPRAGLQTSAKAVLPQTSSGTGHTRLATEKWVMERMQKNNPKRSLVNEWRGYNAV